MAKLYFDPTIVAAVYLSRLSKLITEQKLMKSVHDISIKLNETDLNIIGNEAGTPDVPYWNSDVCNGLIRSSKLEIVKSKRTEKNLFFRKGNNIKNYIRSCKKIFPDETEKINKVIEEYISENP